TRLSAVDLDDRRLVGAEFGVTGTGAQCSRFRHEVDILNPQVGTQRSIGFLRFALCGQRPHHFLVAKILWHTDLEHEAIAPRLEPRRLSLIGSAWLDVILWTDRH